MTLSIKEGCVLASYFVILASSLTINKTRAKSDNNEIGDIHSLVPPARHIIQNFDIGNMGNKSTEPGPSPSPGPLIFHKNIEEIANVTKNVTSPSKMGRASSRHENTSLGAVGAAKNTLASLIKPRRGPALTFTNGNRTNISVASLSVANASANNSDTLYFLPRTTHAIKPVTSNSSIDDVRNGTTWNSTRLGVALVPATAPAKGSNFNAGDVVGVVLGVVTLLLIVLTALLCIRNRRKRTTSHISYIRQDNLNDKSPLTTKGMPGRDPVAPHDRDDILQEFYEDDFEREMRLSRTPPRLDLRLRKEDELRRDTPATNSERRRSIDEESDVRDGGDVEDEFYYDEVFGKSEFTDERTKSAIKDLSITELPEEVPDSMFKQDEFDDIFKTRLS